MAHPGFSSNACPSCFSALPVSSLLELPSALSAALIIFGTAQLPPQSLSTLSPHRRQPPPSTPTLPHGPTPLPDWGVRGGGVHLCPCGVEGGHFTASSGVPRACMVPGAERSSGRRTQGGLKLVAVTVPFPALTVPFTKGGNRGQEASPAFPGAGPAGLRPTICSMPSVGSRGTLACGSGGK